MTRKSTGSQPALRIVLRVTIHYTVLVVAGVIVWKWLPKGGALAPASLEALFGQGHLEAAQTAVGAVPAIASTDAASALDDVSMAITVAVAMFSAVLLALPVAWVYLLTRAKRGYRQSVVQLLIMLPTVVAGIVILVKYSLALAFSLAGIVAAVRFRNSLDDSKDAVYVFLATAIGLAAAVNLPVALVLSICFNVTVLMLWYTDFGSAPVELDGRIAEKRLQRAKDLARTGTFVAHMDEEVFRDMTREQLQGVAERAWKRASAVTGEEPAVRLPVESRLFVHTRNAALVRRAIEPRLQEFVKGWRFSSLGAIPADDGEAGIAVLEYVVQLKKRVSPTDLMAMLRAAGSPEVLDVEIR